MSDKINEDYATLFSSPLGEKVMTQILIDCNFWSQVEKGQTPFDAGMDEGLRTAALMIIRKLGNPQTAEKLRHSFDVANEHTAEELLRQTKPEGM